MYYRLQEGQTWDVIPKDVLGDCAQLTKANSIEGGSSCIFHVGVRSKKARQQEGQCNHHLHAMVELEERWLDGSRPGGLQRPEEGKHAPTETESTAQIFQVKKIHVAERENPIVNRLNKTRVERFPELRAEKEASLKAAKQKDSAAQRERVSNCSLHRPCFHPNLCPAKGGSQDRERKEGKGLAAGSRV